MATERADGFGLEGGYDPLDELEYVDCRAKEVKVRFERPLGEDA
jgi:hypothetical protein